MGDCWGTLLAHESGAWVSTARLIDRFVNALWITARKESAATRYCSLPLPKARWISPRPLSSNAPNRPEVESDSTKSSRVEISDMKVPVETEGTEKMSSNRGTPCAGYDASEKIWE